MHARSVEPALKHHQKERRDHHRLEPIWGEPGALWTEVLVLVMYRSVMLGAGLCRPLLASVGTEHNHHQRRGEQTLVMSVQVMAGVGR